MGGIAEVIPTPIGVAALIHATSAAVPTIQLRPSRKTRLTAETNADGVHASIIIVAVVKVFESTRDKA
ncbi:hypothetical protein BRW65_26965 [Mycobacterium paraffinicum]|uniref:Uncharacterized protein n=1 Tax=Mycobacterium paraffinicum TaxID=53378 RepID=A0A1Q4HH13_9MYCO|nr:hypothetical protein BRW65_26965 [Mycobacterium paraffinicum]